MCAKCIELDEKIEHCRKLSTWIVDKQALDAIEILIESYKVEKAALHPERK